MIKIHGILNTHYVSFMNLEFYSYHYRSSLNQNCALGITLEYIYIYILHVIYYTLRV